LQPKLAIVFDTLERISSSEIRDRLGVAAAAAVRIVGWRGVGFHVIAPERAAAPPPPPAAAPSARPPSMRKLCNNLVVVRSASLSCHSAFEGDLRDREASPFQILLSDFGQFAPHHNLVPLGALLALAVLIFVGLSVAWKN